MGSRPDVVSVYMVDGARWMYVSLRWSCRGSEGGPSSDTRDASRPGPSVGAMTAGVPACSKSWLRRPESDFFPTFTLYHPWTLLYALHPPLLHLLPSPLAASVSVFLLAALQDNWQLKAHTQLSWSRCPPSAHILPPAPGLGLPSFSHTSSSWHRPPVILPQTNRADPSVVLYQLFH